MTHGLPCELATGSTCDCDCFGSGHGAALITAITKSGSVEQHSLQRVNQSRWVNQSNGEAPSGRTRSVQERRAAAAAVAEIVVAQIAAEIPEKEQEAVQRLAKAISADLVAELTQALNTPERRRKVAGHFWCSVLAATCKAYDEAVDVLKQGLDESVDAVMDALQSSNIQEEGRGSAVRSVVLRVRQGEVTAFADELLEQVVRGLVKKTLRAMLAALDELGEETVVKYLRLIGMLVCPDSGSHPAVVRYCIWPLVSGPFQDQVAESLRDWICIEYLHLKTRAKTP